MAVTEVEDNTLTAHTAIELVTSMINATSYIADLLALLIWPNSLIHLRLRLRLRAPPQGVILTPKEYEDYLRLTQAAKFATVASVA